MKLSKREFVSAAVAYFAETGLDPTKERVQGLATVSVKVGTEAKATREHNADIGNRLMGLLRAWEQQQYQYWQTVQGGLFNYLEQIEANLLRNQENTAGALGSRMLVPLLEHGIKGAVDSYMARTLAERVLLKVRGKEESEWAGTTQNSDIFRDQQVMAILHEVAAVPQPTAAALSKKPQAVAVPARVPLPKKKED